MTNCVRALVVAFTASTVFAASPHPAWATPDFIVVGVDGPSSATAGQSISVTVRVGNQGGSITQSGVYIRTSIILSTDPTISLSDSQLTTFDAPRDGLQSGLVYPVNVPVPLPSWATGSYYIGAYVDSPLYWTETNDNNNTGYDSSPITVSGACTPSCGGKCGGAPDGCGGSCTGSCGTNQVCSNQSCVTISPSLGISPNPVTANQNVTFTCTLGSAGAGATVAFFVTQNGTIVASQQVTANGNGVATWTRAHEPGSWWL
ncbi:MAG: hypothetical protein HY699_22095 [Deltaproteobacteria bacterium]|nr:hypothetical protein [Deltaproteobacteria bacterium]